MKKITTLFFLMAFCLLSACTARSTNGVGGASTAAPAVPNGSSYGLTPHDYVQNHYQGNGTTH